MYRRVSSICCAWNNLTLPLSTIFSFSACSSKHCHTWHLHLELQEQVNKAAKLKQLPVEKSGCWGNVEYHEGNGFILSTDLLPSLAQDNSLIFALQFMLPSCQVVCSLWAFGAAVWQTAHIRLAQVFLTGVSLQEVNLFLSMPPHRFYNWDTPCWIFFK